MFGKLKRFIKDSRGASMMNKVVGIFVGALLAAYLLPSALLAIDNATTTDWNASTVAIWGVLGVIIVVAILITFIKQVQSR